MTSSRADWPAYSIWLIYTLHLVPAAAHDEAPGDVGGGPLELHLHNVLRHGPSNLSSAGEDLEQVNDQDLTKIEDYAMNASISG